MSATSSDGRGKAARYGVPPPVFLRLRRVPRSSSGLSTAEIMPVEGIIQLPVEKQTAV